MNTKNLVFVALFSSIMGVLGLIPPIALAITPVPITLQSLGVMLAGGQVDRWTDGHRDASRPKKVTLSPGTSARV